MCGLIAIFCNERNVDLARFKSALSALTHRGPDGAGTWSNGRVALGHRRLAVVDLAGGAQPLSNEDGTLHLVANGEVYGHQSLRKELEARGHRFKTRSDSEVLLHLYESEGDHAIERLRGEMAFIMWDERRQELLAVRDRFGVKPLVWAEHEGAVWVASEAKALFALGVPAAWDTRALACATALQYPPPGATLFRGIREVPPGCRLRVSSRGVQLERWGDLDFPALEQWVDDDVEAERSLEAALGEAVQVRLQADVEVAFQLSGGLDSSAVLALAHRPGAHVFNVRFSEQQGYDESEQARRVASHLGAVCHEVEATPEELVAVLPQAIAHGEGFAVNAHIAAKFLLSRTIQKAGFKVVLTGEGSDEILGGYPHFRVEALGEKEEHPDAASVGILLGAGPSISLDGVEQHLGFVPEFLAAKGTLGRRVRQFLSSEFLASASEQRATASMVAGIDVSGQLKGRHRMHQSAYLWAKVAFAPYLLRTLGDGMEMAHGIEGRLPFLDPQVFKAARQIAPATLWRGGVEKQPLRSALASKLPLEVISARKHPFMAPPLFSVSADVGGLLRDLLKGPHRPPFIDVPQLEKLLDKFSELPPSEKKADDPALMLLLSAAVLHRHYRLGFE